MEIVRFKKSIDSFTGDINLDFFIDDKNIGSVVLEYIDNPHQFIGEMIDTIEDLDEDILDPDDLEGGFYVQDIWMNRGFRGKGYFKPMMDEIIRYIDLNKDEYAVTVLRAINY